MKYHKVIESEGAYPRYIVTDINLGRAEIQSQGFVGTEPVVIINEKMKEVFKRNIYGLRRSTYWGALLKNDLVSQIKISEDLVGDDEVLLCGVKIVSDEYKVEPEEIFVLIQNIKIDDEDKSDRRDNVFRFKSSGAWPEGAITDIGKALLEISPGLSGYNGKMFLLVPEQIRKAFDGLLPGTGKTYWQVLTKIFKIDKLVEFESEHSEYSGWHPDTVVLFGYNFGDGARESIKGNTTAEIFDIKFA